MYRQRHTAAQYAARQLASEHIAEAQRGASRVPTARIPAAPTVLVQQERSGIRRAWLGSDEGAATAEYAVATMAAVGFAGLLIIILRGDEVRGILTDLVRNALTVG